MPWCSLLKLSPQLEEMNAYWWEVRRRSFGPGGDLSLASSATGASLLKWPLVYFLFSELEYSLRQNQTSLHVYKESQHCWSLTMKIVSFVTFKCVCLTRLWNLASSSLVFVTLTWETAQHSKANWKKSSVTFVLTVRQSVLFYVYL